MHQKYSILIVAAMLLLASCTKKLESINTNPNAPITASPDLLLRQVEYSFGENNSYEGFVAGNVLGQYFTMVDFNLFDRHNLYSPQYGGKPWSYLYSNLRDNENLLIQSRASVTYKVYEGPALILKAYMTAVLTDLYGDVPYFNALKGKSGITTPGYDKQELIYTAPDGILDNLEKGIAAIKEYNGIQTLNGDILYGGDLSKWQKFANSLRIKYLLRIADKVPVADKLQTIYTEGNYILNSTENAVFSFTDGPPNSFRMATLRIGDFDLFILSQTMEEIMNKYTDPRLATFYRPTAANPAIYKGLLNGQDASQTSITVANYSLSGKIFRENTGKLKANFITDWETALLLAEAAQKGLITADDKQLYESGIQKSFDYWQTSMPAAYLTSGPAAYGSAGADKLEQIITQKWISNIINGYEGWIEWRRTGYPKLKLVAASLNQGIIPVRMPYPADEAALNADNYANASAATNGNSVNSKVWWQVK